MRQATYSEKLKDPRWQKKRLEVMKRNDFHCEICGDGESTLHVHHKEYFKGREIWEYEPEQLAVVCKDCHDNLHAFDDFLKTICSYAPMDGPRNRDELALIVAGHLGIEYEVVLEMSQRWQDCPYTRAAYEAGQRMSDDLDNLISEHLQRWRKEQEEK